MVRHERKRPAGRRMAAAIGAGLVVVLLAGACTAERPQEATIRASGNAAPITIPQPELLGDLQVAPPSERVDMAMPAFSDPTNITNPLFPVSAQRSVLLLGKVDGQAFRTEVTLLPEPRIIEWGGQRIPALVSQYTAYLDGRIHEVAYDFYAQADDGSVWYLGEDVFNFHEGAIANTHGTWIAGKDGPAAMIMPVDPQEGDVYRPENIPGFVFEEVTVRSTNQTVDGPFGPISGALVVEELHMDGTTEEKIFAPGYGEFYTAAGGDTEALAMGVPTDALPTPVPAELTTLSDGALEVFRASQAGEWGNGSAMVGDMATAWEQYRAGEVPARVDPVLSRALSQLSRAVDGRDADAAGQAAIDVAQSSLDLQLRHRPVAEVDLARFDLWLLQLQLDAANGDASAVNGDFFTLDYIRDRIQHTLHGADLTRVNAELEALYEIVSALPEASGPSALSRGLADAADAARQLGETVAGIVTAA
jgi:hypothetical protein